MFTKAFAMELNATWARRGLIVDTIESSSVDGPGDRFVVLLQGCTFNCLVCHNPETIPRRVLADSRWIDVDELLGEIRVAAPTVSGITVSGGEATCQWPFVAELLRGVKSDPELAHLSCFVDTNGDAAEHVWDALGPWMDQAMVDLKAFDPDVHQFLTGRGNERVLNTIPLLAARGQLYEVRLLLVPGVNDDDAQLLRTADWLHRAAAGVPVRVVPFRQRGARAVAAVLPEMDADQLRRAAATLSLAGITEVFAA